MTTMPTRQTLGNALRPHYVLRPRQFARRIAVGRGGVADELTFRLPWGHDIDVDTRENVGEYIVRWGVFDLLVCEVLLRLADVGETAIDAGANIGQMTSLLASAVAPEGRVISFEPHPRTFARLSRNAARWASGDHPALDLHETGLSDATGVATLATDVYETNAGSPSLEPLREARGPVDRHEVALETLDDVLGDRTRVGVMKIDVEGHEAALLRGAERALRAHRIRDIVFEEHQEPPTPVTELLRERGYALMSIEERFRGPVAGRLDDPGLSPGGDRSLLATADPRRAIARLAPRGWAVYGIGPAARRTAGR